MNYKYWPTNDLIEALPYAYGSNRAAIRKTLKERGAEPSAGDRFTALPVSEQEILETEKRMREKIGCKALCFVSSSNEWRETAVQNTMRSPTLNKVYFRLIDLQTGAGYLRAENSPFLKVLPAKTNYKVTKDMGMMEEEFRDTADELADLAGIKCSYGSEGGGRVVRAGYVQKLGAAVLIQTVRGRKWVSISDEQLRLNSASCTDSSASCTDSSASCSNVPLPERVAAGADVFGRMVALSATIKNTEDRIESEQKTLKKLKDEYEKLHSLYQELQGKR